MLLVPEIPHVLIFQPSKVTQAICLVHANVCCRLFEVRSVLYLAYFYFRSLGLNG
jgi:hypothetical protein